MAALEPDLLGRLLGLLAHDLRNPLAAIQSNLGYVEGAEVFDADAKDALSDASVSCDALAHIVDNLEILGVLLRGDGAPGPQPFDANALVADVAASCAAAARSHDVTLSTGPRGAPIVASADRECARRCLANLVRNSIQLAPGGSEVALSVLGRDGEVVVRVEDAGDPPPEGRADDVFTAEGQIEGKTRPGGRYSRGLGLFAAGIAARRGGAVVSAVEPRAGFRNAFELVLPAA